jgi:hypothetical protein
VPQDQGAGIRPGCEAVVLPAIDLHLVFIEPVPEIAGDYAERCVEAFWIVDRKRQVGQMLSLELGNRGANASGGKSTSDWR